jgi:hypothetical protein
MVSRPAPSSNRRVVSARTTARAISIRGGVRCRPPDQAAPLACLPRLTVPTSQRHAASCHARAARCRRAVTVATVLINSILTLLLHRMLVPNEDQLLRQGEPREACSCPHDSGCGLASSRRRPSSPPITSVHAGLSSLQCLLLIPSSFPPCTDHQVRREAVAFPGPLADQKHKPTHAPRFAVFGLWKGRVRACVLASWMPVTAKATCHSAASSLAPYPRACAFA